MADQTFAVQWTGLQALVTLPQHIDSSNAGQIREQLLWIINRGAVVLIADLAGTVSCDYSGADALARAHSRAVANRTELRLVVAADAVRRVLSVNGLDRLAAVYPDLDAALAAGPGRHEPGSAQRTPMPGRPGRAEELLHVLVARIFDVALILQAAIDLPPDVTMQRITEALGLLDDVIREARDHVFEDGQGIEPDRAWRPPRHVLQRSAQAKDRSTLLQRHVAQTAHALHLAAADTAALLAQRADLIDQPGRIDYPTEIKRLRALADQARQMAERWKQP
jgi:anti-sigma B factor antagonist